LLAGAAMMRLRGGCSSALSRSRDVERRFAAALCLCSHAVDTDKAGRARYEQSDAERFARALLIPREEFAAISGRPDVELAETVGAPLANVALRRRDCFSP
jgi:hypothetical protein